MSFYQRLIAKRDVGNLDQRIVVAIDASAPHEQEIKVLQTHNVQPDKLIKLDFRTLNINHVPTLFSVDKAGKVTNYFRGKLDGPTEQ